MSLPTWQSLIEKFLTGVPSSDGYTEIFLNPTPSEWAKAGTLYRFQPTWNLSYGTSGFLLRGLLTIDGDAADASLFVWDGDKSFHEQVIRYLRDERLLSGQSGIDFLPLDLMYIPSSKTVSVATATFSMADTARMMRTERVMDLCRESPAFRGLTVVNDGPLTESFFKDYTIGSNGSTIDLAVYHNPTWSEKVKNKNRCQTVVSV